MGAFEPKREKGGDGVKALALGAWLYKGRFA